MSSGVTGVVSVVVVTDGVNWCNDVTLGVDCVVCVFRCRAEFAITLKLALRCSEMALKKLKTFLSVLRSAKVA